MCIAVQYTTVQACNSITLLCKRAIVLHACTVVRCREGSSFAGSSELPRGSEDVRVTPPVAYSTLPPLHYCLASCTDFTVVVVVVFAHLVVIVVVFVGCCFCLCLIITGVVADYCYL